MAPGLTRREEFLRALELDRSRNNAAGRMNIGLFGLMGKKDLKGMRRFANSLSSGYFQTMRELNPPQMMLTNQRVTGVQWLIDHACALSFLVLADLLSESQLTTKALEEASREHPPELRKNISPKQIQRLANEYYSNVVYTVVKHSHEVKKLMDNPKLIVWGPPRPTRPIAENDDRIRLIATNYSQKGWNQSFSFSDLADPFYLGLFEKYWRTTLQLVPALHALGPMRKDSYWIFDRFAAGDYVAHVFFQNVMDETIARWWEESLKARAKFSIADFTSAIFWPKYTAGHARKTIERFRELRSAFDGQRASRRAGNDSEVLILDQLASGALTYMKRGNLKVGMWLFEECLSQDLFRGEYANSVCSHNLASSLILTGDYKRVPTLLATAIDCWRHTQNLARFVTDSGLTLLTTRSWEGPAALKKQRDGLLAMLESLPPGEQARISLELSDYASLKGDHESERAFLSKGLSISAPAEATQDYAEHFSKRIGDLGNGKLLSYPIDAEKAGPLIPKACYEERKLNGVYLSFCGGFPHLH